VIERPGWAEGDGRLWSREWQAAETLTGGEEGERDEKGREEEDAGQGRWVGEKGEDLHGAAAGGTEERQDLVDTGEEYGPADPRRAGGARRLVLSAGGERGWLGGLGVGETRRLGRSSTDGDDGGT